MQIVQEDNGSPQYNPLTHQSILTWVETVEQGSSPFGPFQYILRKAVYKIVPREVPLEPPASLEDRVQAAETIIDLLLMEGE